jgi:hypothetical protein
VGIVGQIAGAIQVAGDSQFCNGMLFVRFLQLRSLCCKHLLPCACFEARLQCFSSVCFFLLTLLTLLCGFGSAARFLLLLIDLLLMLLQRGCNPSLNLR